MSGDGARVRLASALSAGWASSSPCARASLQPGTVPQLARQPNRIPSTYSVTLTDFPSAKIMLYSYDVTLSVDDT